MRKWSGEDWALVIIGLAMLLFVGAAIGFDVYDRMHAEGTTTRVTVYGQ